MLESWLTQGYLLHSSSYEDTIDTRIVCLPFQTMGMMIPHSTFFGGSSATRGCQNLFSVCILDLNTRLVLEKKDSAHLSWDKHRNVGSQQEKNVLSRHGKSTNQNHPKSKIILDGVFFSSNFSAYFAQTSEYLDKIPRGRFPGKKTTVTINICR